MPPANDGGERVGGGETHARLEVYLPGAGWVEFDPANGLVGNRDLIRVTMVRDPSQAIPISGEWTGAPANLFGMEVEVSVTLQDYAGLKTERMEGQNNQITAP